MSALPPFEPTKLLRRLVDGAVDFVVVGGVAVVVQAMPRWTKDLDICYATDADNLDALGAVLVAARATLHGADADLPFVPDGRTLRRTQILTSQVQRVTSTCSSSLMGARPIASSRRTPTALKSTASKFSSRQSTTSSP